MAVASILAKHRASESEHFVWGICIFAARHDTKPQRRSPHLEGYLTNGVNKPSLNFILNHLPELGQWLYDLIKPGSVLGRFPVTDSTTKTPDAEFPGMDNPYNELALQLPENRNAVVCQAQRVALTIVAILKMGRGKMPNRLDDVQLNASLPSDFEAAEPNTLIESAQSSKAAQKALEQELRGALWPAAGKVPHKIVMIAHSQACLALRLALQTLVTEIPKGSAQRRIIKERLRIFTFGNPSIDWKAKNGTEHPLSEYVHTTEHFCERDRLCGHARRCDAPRRLGLGS
ncbi:hypothetical protein MRS44_013917 [Fusarium solani]|uniref:uncharacterized protein n=1 Tax=Fusarium solani TaxID=169388 RepID=UPI0032C4A726|nr:hypothetical protein MRS44_013917 [Fusarium solani]